VQLHAKLARSSGRRRGDQCGEPVLGRSSPVGYPVATFPLTWRARRNEGMFPEMRAKLLVYRIQAGARSSSWRAPMILRSCLG